MSIKHKTAIVVPDDAYSASSWDANLEVPTKNAVRDKLETALAYINPFGLPNNIFASGVVKQLYQNNILTGAIRDIYTCPASTRAYVSPMFFGNPTASSATLIPYIRTGGNDRRLYLNTSLSAAAHSQTNVTQCQIILEAGEKIGLSTSVSGIMMCGTVIEFPTTSVLKTVSISVVPGTGAQLIYTCPASKTAHILASNGSDLRGASGVSITNDSGGTRTYKLYMVPSGATLDTAKHEFWAASTTANNSTATPNFPPVLMDGDKIYVDFDATTAGQFLWFNVAEIDV